MKKGWQSLKLSDIALEVKGTAEIHGRETYQLWSVPSFSDGEPEVVKGGTIKSAKRPVQQGDVLLCKINPRINRVWVVGDSNGLPQVASTEWITLRPKDKSAIFADYLRHFLASPSFREWITSDTKGATGSHTRAKPKEVLRHQVPVPLLSEQRRIVAILDEAFEGIAAAKANVEKNLRNATELFEGWREALFQEDSKASSGQHLLGDLVNVQNGFAFKSGDYCDGGHFVVRIGNVQDGELVLENPRFIALTDPKQKKFVLNVGDILVSLTGNIGRAAIVEAHHLPAVLNQRVARITTKTNAVSHEWVYAFLTSQSFRQRLQTAGHGAAQQNVSTKEIESVPLCLPSKNEQERQIAQVLAMRSSVAEWKESYARRSAALDELKASLLHQAFTGQL